MDDIIFQVFVQLGKARGNFTVFISSITRLHARKLFKVSTVFVSLDTHPEPKSGQLSLNVFTHAVVQGLIKLIQNYRQLMQVQSIF